MPDIRGLPRPFAAFRRSILGIVQDQAHTVETNHESVTQDMEFESFQKQVSERFNDLLATHPAEYEFLSLTWVSKLLDVLVDCQEEFKVILCNNKAHLVKPPLDKMVSELFERSIKALDICNATRDGIEKIRLWQKHLDVVLSAFGSRERMITEGSFRRARKALMDLALVMLEDKDSGCAFSQRNRSFARKNKGKDLQPHPSGHSRSLSWSVSHSWSATKQLQLMASSLAPPRPNEIAATNGLAIPVFTMSFVLMFVLWALVAAVPCQDRSLQIHFSIPRQFTWYTPFNLLHCQIMDESKRQDRRNSVGLLQEISQLENSIGHVTDLVDYASFPLTDEQKEEAKQGVEELSVICELCKNGMDPLDRQLREVFRKIMSFRAEGLELLGKTN
ncbi:protein BYPASS1-LIKE-like [Apium graveolens]|uniref:protein BYPASS1-LIKE-like n=1 Tax=Apium graveolens TaxID=4045 RepID=UPI003D7BCA92